MRQHAELAAQGFKTESDNRIAKAKLDAAEAERQERVRAAARMEAIRQEANKEEAAKIVNKANGKANGDAMRSGGSSTHDLSALEDMTDLDIEALAKSANATPEPPRVSEEEAKKQVRCDCHHSSSHVLATSMTVTVDSNCCVTGPTLHSMMSNELLRHARHET